MNRIKELRVQKGLNQNDLAKELSVAQNTISQWETGKRNIDNEDIILLCGFFDVSSDYLLGLSDQKNGIPPTEPDFPDPDEEFWELRDKLHKRPEMKILFDASKKATKEDIETVAKLMDRLSNKDE
jgi:transcriptional regulator with XRE-family HTH domain